MGFNSSAVIASVLGSLLVVGIVLVVTNSNDVNAPAEAQQTELMWGDNSAPLGLVDGWNTSVGTAAEREAAARHFHVTIADDDSLWKHNVFTPFAGKTLKMVGIDILKRNAFNTLIEYKVKQGNVAWTVEPGPHGVWGPMVEHIDGKYTGTSRNAGYASPSEWIENDYKVFLGHKIENDWGLVNATSWDKTTVVIDYQSYQKGHFIMTWQLPQEGEVKPTELQASACMRPDMECNLRADQDYQCCAGSTCVDQPGGTGVLPGICVDPNPEPKSSPTPEPTYASNHCGFATCNTCDDGQTQCVGAQCIDCHDPKNTATCEHPPPGPPPVYPSETNCLSRHYWPPKTECTGDDYPCDPHRLGGPGRKGNPCCPGLVCTNRGGPGIRGGPGEGFHCIIGTPGEGHYGKCRKFYEICDPDWAASGHSKKSKCCAGTACAFHGGGGTGGTYICQ